MVKSCGTKKALAQKLSVMAKNGSIQGLKGCAALVVFFSHALFFPILPFAQDLKVTPLHFFFDGQIAVIVFISISGWFYQKRELPSVKGYALGLVKKVVRIYVPYIPIIILAFFLCNMRIPWDTSLYTPWANSFWVDSVSLRDLFTTLSIVLPHDTHLLDPPIWYLSYEVRFFVFIPLLVILCNNTRLGPFVYIPFVLLMFLGKGQYYGACICACLTRFLYDSYGGFLFKGRRKWISPVTLLTSLFLLNSSNVFLGLPKPFLFSLQAIGGSLIVAYFSYYKDSFLSHPLFVWLGDISYEFYLIHFIILLLFRSLGLQSFVLIGCSFAIALLLSVLLHKIFLFLQRRVFVFSSK